MEGSQYEEDARVSDERCPWCEADFVLRIVDVSQTCSECGTTWSYEDESEDDELALAA